MNHADFIGHKPVPIGAYALLLFIIALVFMPAVATCATSWDLSVDERNGLPALSIGRASAMSSDFAFWGKNWAWAGLDTKFKITAPYAYSITGINRALNFSLNAHIERTSNQGLRWDIDLEAPSSTPDVIGGGISFQFDLDSFRPQLGEPELLPDNSGWTWGRSSAATLELRFDPPLPAVYFEQGRKSEIRALFYKGEIPSGSRHYTATLTLSGDIAVGPTVTEQFALKDPNAWPTDIVDWKRAPVDLSFLNAAQKPAGKHGFLTAANGHLSFADGTPARFWGTNLTAYALFGTTRDAVKLQAHRLAEFGFNLVRIHHHDSSWVVPNIFDRPALDTKNLNITALEKLDWWIKCLEDEGIYIWLDLEDGRQFKIADGIDDFNEIAKGKATADLKGYNYVNASIERAMQRFNDAFLNHRNAFNSMAYKDDPGIAALLLTNENDVTFHFGNALLPDKQVPRHTALYMAQATAFAAKFGLPKDKTWRSWEHGPSKLFLNDLEHGFDIQMIRHLREIGVKAPIVTTSSWGNAPLSSLPALTSGDLIDVHAYGEIDELHKNPVFAAPFLAWMAAAHVIDRPLTVTEWNVSPFPALDRHTSPLFVASSAAYQGWDGLMQFAYAQQPLTGPGAASNWEAYNDPSLLATLPAAALLFRRGDVQEAKTTYVFMPRPKQLFDQLISPKNSVAIRTAVEKGKLLLAIPATTELPWLEESHIPPDAQVITDPNRSLLSLDATYAVSDTGEIRHDWGQGIYTIDTPRSQVATGWIGGKTINLSEVSVALATPNASVAIQSLDQNDISQSRNILISLGSASVPQAGNRTPFRSQPISGELMIRAVDGLKLYAQRGSVSLEVPFSYELGHYRISLSQTMGSHWLILQ
jgi:hypothetical protein